MHSMLNILKILIMVAHVNNLLKEILINMNYNIVMYFFNLIKSFS